MQAAAINGKTPSPALAVISPYKQKRPMPTAISTGPKRKIPMTTQTLPPSNPDRKQQVEQFLRALFESYYGDHDRERKGFICVTGIEQPKPPGGPPRIQEKFFASIDAVLQSLRELEGRHDAGLDVYVCANPLRTSHRTAENVDAQVCVHADLDDRRELPPCVR